MNGATHALTGLAAGAVIAPAVSADPAGRVSFLVIVGGMALLSDWDTGSSTISGFWGPFSRLPGKAIGKAARGHRAGTHDVCVAPFVFAALALLATLWPAGRMVVLALAVGLGLRAVGAAIPGREAWDAWPINLLLSWGTAYLIVHQGAVVPSWMPLAVAVGTVVHIGGDWVTKQGVPVPLTWLSTVRRVSLTSWSASSKLLNWTAAAASLVLVAVLSSGWAGLDPVGSVLTAWRSL